MGSSQPTDHKSGHKSDKTNFDVIIIGAGHNGLVTAGYLAKKGLKVGVFEKRGIEGGCAVTQENWPGFKVSSLSYVNSLFKPQIVKDLDLKNYGFEMLPRSPSSFTPFLDGRYMLLGPDKDLCHEQISKFSKKDAKNYPLYEQALTELSEILEPMMTMVPINPAKMSFSEVMTYGKFGVKNRKNLKERWPEIMRFMAGSATDMLNEWFESDELKATLATDAIIGANASPSMPGTAYILFHHVMGECNGVRGVWGYMRGGMGGLTQSLAKSCKAKGVEIFTNAGVKNIIVENGRAVGIAMADGREHRANLVVSNADPNITFNHLISSSDLPAGFLSDVRRINYDSASVKINLALSELPNFTAIPGTAPGPHHRGTIHLCPSMQFIEEGFADSLVGRPSRNPILECTIPSVLDNTVAPPGKHVMNIFVQYGPYKLTTGKTWDQEKEPFADRCIDVLEQYAPNIKSAIMHREVITPLDLEREYSLTGGSLFHGRLTLDQMFNMRPVPGYSDYRTPLKGLYLCGSGTHPGGGVTGIPGWNAYNQIVNDKAWRL
jgi:phytoene dehydrogenase-like protein